MSGASASRVTHVGEITVVALPDGAADLPGWPMAAELANNDPVDWPSYAERNPGGFHGPEHSGGSTTPVSPSSRAAKRHWSMRGRRGALSLVRRTARRATGLDGRRGPGPEDIGRVFLTHAHPDHVGWTFDEERGAPRFPSARYVLHPRDWAEFAGRSPEPKHFTRYVAPLERAGVLDLLDGERDVAPGVTAIETPGHTPGHMSLIIRSRGDGMVISGDVLNSPMYVSEPGRPFGPDLDQETAVRTRVALVERIEAEGWRVAAAHFPEPGFGAVVRVEGKRWFAAL